MLKRVLWIVILVAQVCAAHAIIPFLNVPDPNFLYVGQIRGASGVAISPHWILCAKHVASTGGTFQANGVQYFPDFWINADGAAGRPATDLVLLHVPTTIPGYYQPYYGSVQGVHATIVGYGNSGVLRADNTGYITDGGSGQIRRAAKNRVSLIQQVSFLGDLVMTLIFDVDGNGRDTFGDGGPIGSEPEGTYGVGDSGGGMFITIGGQPRLIGINAFLFDLFTPAGSPDPLVDFGDGGGATALFAYADWIQSTIGGPTVNPAGFSVTMGVQTGGNLNSLFARDDNRITIQCDEMTPNGQIELVGFSPTATASQIHFNIESSSSRVDQTEIVRLWNYQTNQWDPAATYVRTPLTVDSRTFWLASTNLTQYIQFGTQEMRAQVTWIPISDTDVFDGWADRLDWAVWQVAPL